ncbi:MAG: transferase [Ignavibacteriales bacterium]|nr:transferase [Ignavibacteriales bacterium]
MQICLFEDIYYDHFEPMILTRPTYNLFCGIHTLRDKVKRAYPGVEVVFHTRGYLKAFIGLKNPTYKVNVIEHDECLFVNGRVIAPPDIADIIKIDLPGDRLYLNGETIIAAKVSGKKLEGMKEGLDDLLTLSNFDGIPVEQVEVKYATYIWDLIHNNDKEIVNDFYAYMDIHGFAPKDRVRGNVHESAVLIEKENIYIHETARIMPGAVIDATDGPVFINSDAIVYPNAVIEGPVCIGKGTKVKSGASIYHGVTVGKVCKVGGEIEGNIISPYTNKQHSGFMGHAYIGSWVNIGADTNNSDLKNNYGTVKITVNGEQIDSGQQFLGLIMGDHSKTAINTMFNTGTVVGFSSNIFGPGFPSKSIPSFAWGGADMMTTYDIEKSIETAKRVVQRRNKSISETEEKLFRKVFDLTHKQRRKMGFPY